MACLPLLCCLIYCGMQGRHIGEVYLPACEWNDELFYFKQVEGIIHYGYPRGYFGFNESHALKLSFAAWSPVLVFPWVIWGLLFGWNLLSPIICNIVLMTLTVFLFVWLVRPTWKQLGVTALLFCFFRPFVRFMLSGMPEIICFSLVILFYALVYDYLRKERTCQLVLLFLMAGLMTLMRPYLLLLLLLPAFLIVRKNKWKGLIISAAVMAVVVATYGLIKHYLGAEYFAPLFFTDWITTFFEQGFGAGVHHFFGKLYYMGRDFLRLLLQGIRSGLASGAYFGGYLVMFTVLSWQGLADYRLYRKQRREKDEQAGDRELFARLVIEVHLILCFVGMLFALLLMYKLTEGSKHLLTFMAAGVFVIGQMRTRTFKKAVLVSVTFAFFYVYRAVDPYDYQVPFSEEQTVDKQNHWEQVFADQLSLNIENVPNYDNVVIWTLNDRIDGKLVYMKWQVLYGLPQGFGISCCMPDYCIEHLEELQSRYLTAVSDGEVDACCKEAGWRELCRDEDLVMYENVKYSAR